MCDMETGIFTITYFSLLNAVTSYTSKFIIHYGIVFYVRFFKKILSIIRPRKYF